MSEVVNDAAVVFGVVVVFAAIIGSFYVEQALRRRRSNGDSLKCRCDDDVVYHDKMFDGSRGICFKSWCMCRGYISKGQPPKETPPKETKS